MISFYYKSNILKILSPFRVFNNMFNLGMFIINRIPLTYLPKIRGRIFIRNHGNIRFGQNVKINSGKKYNIIGGDRRTNIMIGKHANCYIGSNVGISNSTIVCRNSIIIEDNVLIGGGCRIYDTDFHSITYTKRLDPFLRGIPDSDVKTCPIIIKTNAWVGAHSIVLKGVTIGEKSIVGAGSVVSKDIPSNEIWSGNPARFIRKLKKLHSGT